MSDSGLPFTPYVPGPAPVEDPAPQAPEATDTDANVGDFQEEAPARQYLDLDDDTAERYVKVTIDGQETEVPLREALSGYQRQADYTRKTQEIADLRKEAEFGIAFQRAMQANPELAIQAVAQKYGISLGQARQAVEAQQRQPDPYDPYDPDPYDDPSPRGQTESVLLQRLERLEQEREAERADRVLQTAIGGLRTSGADEQDVRLVIQQAMQMRVGPEAFPVIFGNLQYSRAQQAQAHVQAAKAQETQQRQQAAAAIGQVVGQGPSAAGAGAPPPQETEFDDIHSAFEAAWKQHVG